MESLESNDSEITNPLDPERLEIAAIIPVRTSIPDSVDLCEPLILETIKVAKNSRYIDQIIISTDNDKMQEQAVQWGATQTILRPAELSAPEVRADTVIQYTLNRLEEQGYYPDLIIPLEITYPFRPWDLLDKLIMKLLEEGLDTVIAGFSDYRPCWIKNGGQLTRVDDHSTNREHREPVHIGLPSLGCITYPEFVRKGSRLGSEIGIYEIPDPIQRIEIRSNEDLRLMKILHEVVPK
jgi:CMP-N-acetylneuraminic acid synthetase